MRIHRRMFMVLICALSAVLLLSACSSQSTNNSASNERGRLTLTIGYQKNGPLVILKSLGTLEKSLKKKGYSVEWREFTAGPALLEALNAGSIDVGRTGDSPPIFAQAADTPFVYVAAGKTKYQGSGILVPKDSAIKSLTDLKGKRIGFAKGSSSHYLLVKALNRAGISYKDIQPSFLQPGDARIAFEKGNIDAWAIWDPFTADTELNSNARMLVNGKNLTTDRDFFLANKEFAKKHKKVLSILFNEIEKSSNWANAHHKELAAMLSPLLKIDEKSLLLSAERREYGIEPITPSIVEEQQEIADTYFDLKIIPKKIKVKDAVDGSQFIK
ncbi:sulfonate ABC transporter substrate-binding protein [Peribacillus kribbensis]|uniref:sulfonate ABC transporter substrate-binding protein n=1 Tax=Peribacillus kribbensis TaxID=356658 RepID=UPI00047EDAD4|nr:sulfonate ABC transporter substrate-binding protein [Peribacillus kribbensis]